MPDGDDAWVARRTMQVATTTPPLIGQESTASDEPLETGLSHLGPTSYYVMAGPYALGGWSPVGIVIGASLVVGGAMVAVAWLATRVAGDRGTLAAGLVLAGLTARLGQEWLVRPTSSVLAVMPLFAALVGLWAFLRRDRAGFVVAIAFGSFAIQTSLVVLPLAGVVVGASLVVAIARFVRAREAPWAGRSWILLVLVAVTWIPPLIDQVTREPGNLADFVNYLYADAANAAREGKRTAALGLGPASATIIDAITNPLGVGDRGLDGAGVWLLQLDQLGLAAPVAFATAVVLAVWWTVRRKRAALATLFAVAAGASVASVLSFSRRPTETLFNSTYFVLWIQAVAALWWLGIALAGVDWAFVVVKRRGARSPSSGVWRPVLVTVPVLVVTAGVVVAAALPRIPRTEADRVRELSSQVRAVLPVDGTYEVEGKGLVAWVSTSKGIGTDLIAHGYDMRFTEWGGMVDEQLRQAEPGMDQIFVVAQENDQIVEVDRSDPSLLGAFRDREAQILVWFIPGGRYAGLCEQIASARANYRTGPLVVDGRVEDPSRLAELLGSVNLDEMARDDGDDVYLQAVEYLREVRRSALPALQQLPRGTPIDELGLEPAVLASIVTILDVHAEQCQVGPGET